MKKLLANTLLLTLALFGTQACRNVPMTLQDDFPIIEGDGPDDTIALQAPSGFSGYASSSSSITVEWFLPEDAQDKTVRIEGKHADSPDSAYTHLQTIDSSLTETLLTQLDEDQEYDLRIQTRTPSQASEFSSAIQVITLADDINVDAPVPSNLQLTSDVGSITLDWQWSQSSTDLISVYQIQRKVGNGLWNSLTSPTFAVNTTHTDGSVNTSTSYSYRIRVVYTDGTYYTTAAVGPASPNLNPAFPKPNNLQATALPGQIQTNWTWSSGSPSYIDTVKVQFWINESGQWVNSGNLSNTTTSWLHIGAATGNAYSYRVFVTYDSGDTYTSPVTGPLSPIDSQLPTPENFHFDNHILNSNNQLVVDLDWTYAMGQIGNVDAFILDLHAVNNITGIATNSTSAGISAPSTYWDNHTIPLSYFFGGTVPDDISIVYTLNAINDFEPMWDPSESTSIQIRCIDLVCAPE